MARRQLLAWFGLGLVASGMVACTGSGNAGNNAGSPSGAASPAAGAASPAAAAANDKPVELTLVSYAVTRSAYEKIIPLFVEQWKKERGQTVEIRQSYGGSGSQARAVIDGLEADVVALALALDVQKIEESGLIEPGWEKESPNDAIIHKSVVALVTRPGNPKGIKDWQDLAKPDVKTITANPKTSGGARWNFLGLWGSVTETGGTPAAAEAFVKSVYGNVPVLPRDAREATDVFLKQRQGDVLINYENEVLLAKAKNQAVEYVVPPINISIDSPVAVVDKNVDKRGTREVSEAFVKFLYTPEAQKAFAEAGFRPIDSAVESQFADRFSKVTKLFTVQQLGGWDTVQKQFFKDGAIFDKIQKKS